MNKRILLLVALIGAVGMLLTTLGRVLAAPSVTTNEGITVDEGSTGSTITSADLEATESGVDPSNITYTVATPPQHGTLFNNGAGLGNNDTFTQADINSNRITYDHNGDEVTSDSFDFQVSSPNGSNGNVETFLITVTAVNDAPTAVADTIYVEEGDNLLSGDTNVLDNDTDPDSTLTAATTSGPSFAAAFNLNSDGSISYTHNDDEEFSDSFTYEACDDGTPTECDTSTVTVVITPVVDIAPDAQNDTFNVDENSNDGEDVGTVQVIDTEVTQGYDSLTFNIESGDNNGYFTINDNGLIEVDANANLDHESDAQYILVVRVTDESGASDNANITININDINEEPFVPSGQTFNLPEDAEDSDMVGTVTASDPDAGDSLNYTIVGGDPSNIFGINDSGILRVTNASLLDYDTLPNSYALDIRVRDNDGLQYTETVTVNLTNVNEAPTINNQNFNIDENPPNGAPVGVLAASDPDSGDTKTFAIVGGNIGDPLAVNPNTGQITVDNNSLFDFEVTTAVTATVEVADGEGLTDSAVVTVNINNVNEAPVVPGGQSFNVAENSGNGTAVGTVDATDDDLDSVPAEELTFTITDGNTNNTFAIDSSSGEITVNNNGLLNHETTPSFTLEITVSDTNWDSDGANQATQNVQVNVTDVNEQPTVNAGQTFTVVGYSSNGTVVGDVTASDPDNGDTLSFAITGGNVEDAFAINSSNGRLTVNNTNALDYQSRPTFNLNIRVTDSGNKFAETTVTINLTQPPEFQIMLPIVLNNYVAPDEPNDRCIQSHGLMLNETQEFFANDAEDWYKFTLSSSRNVTVELTNYNAQGQIVAYSGACSSLTLLGNNGNFLPTKILNLGTLPAGQYYVRVVTDAPFNTTTPYNLRIIAP